MGEHPLCCLSPCKVRRSVFSTGVSACSWTLQIADPSRVVVAGGQVSLELRDSSLMGLFTITMKKHHPLHFPSCLLFLHYKVGQFLF